jgi:hypothetical protein
MPTLKRMEKLATAPDDDGAWRGATVRTDERHYPYPLIPASVKFADHGKDSDSAADMRGAAA